MQVARHRIRRARWPWIVASVLAAPLLVVGIGYTAQLGTGGDYYGENGQFAHVSVGSPFAHIAGHPAFKGFGDYIGPWKSGFVAAITRPLPWRSSRRTSGTRIRRLWWTT